MGTNTSVSGRTKNRDLIYTVARDNLPTNLRFIVELYVAVPDSEFKYKFDDRDGRLYEYRADAVMGHAKFEFDRDSKEFTISGSQLTRFNEEIRSLQSALDRQRSACTRTSQTRQSQRRQEARAIEGDRCTRYRGDTVTMTRTRRQRTARRTGSTTVNVGRGRELKVGMRVRLYHEV